MSKQIQDLHADLAGDGFSVTSKQVENFGGGGCGTKIKTLDRDIIVGNDNNTKMVSCKDGVVRTGSEIEQLSMYGGATNTQKNLGNVGKNKIDTNKKNQINNIRDGLRDLAQKNIDVVSKFQAGKFQKKMDSQAVTNKKSPIQMERGEKSRGGK